MAARGATSLREIEVRLVEADDLDAMRGGAHELHDAFGCRAVGREVGCDEDRVGTQPPCARRRHRRSDPELARLVGRGRDDGPRPAARDDHRQAVQLGPAQQLDAGIERVDVEMGDRSHGRTR
jgi:hypothetical protein